MNSEIEKQIAALFLNLSEYENKIELIRQNLAEFEEFEPYAIFQRISRLGKGYISQKEISDFLEFNGMNSYEKDLEFLIRVYDSNDDKRLSYRDFLNFILPHSSPELRQMCTQRQSYAVNSDEILPWEIEFKLAKLIELEISMFNETDSLKNGIVNLPEFNLKDIFACLSGANNSWIDMSSLADFFSKMNFHFKDHDLFCIIKRIDKDQDGSICYSDFVEFILPIKPYTRLSLNSALNKSNNDISATRNTPQKPKSNVSPNTHLFPAHFKCNSCNLMENKLKNPLNNNELEDTNNINNNYISRNINNNSNSIRNSLHIKEIPQKKMSYDTHHITTNLTYTQSNRDSFRTPTKNQSLESNKNMYFSTKPISNNRIQNNDTAKDYKGYESTKEYKSYEIHKNYEKKEVTSINKNPQNIVKSSFVTYPKDNPSRTIFEKKEEIKPKTQTKTILSEEIKVQMRDLFFLEKSIKLFLEELYSDFDLDLYQMFKFFDLSNQEKIDSKCLELKLREFDIFISKFEIYCFVEKYDKTNKGFLNYLEFSSAFLNKYPFPEKKFKNGSKIARNFEKKLSKILGLIINFECDCLMLKKLYEKNSTFSFLDLYVEQFKGEILLEEYLEFLKKYELQRLDEFQE